MRHRDDRGERVLRLGAAEVEIDPVAMSGVPTIGTASMISMSPMTVVWRVLPTPRAMFRVQLHRRDRGAGERATETMNELLS